MTTGLTVRAVTPAEHLAYVREVASASYLQCPSWGRMPPGWQPESVGWFDGERVCGVGLVLYRRVPLVGALAYLPEGPVVDWATLGADDVLRPLLRFLHSRRVFSVKVTPNVVLHRWRAEALRKVLRDGGEGRLRDVTPNVTDPTAAGLVGYLRASGWQQYEAPGPGFGGRMHPRYRSHVPLGGADPADGLDTQWRRNVRKAEASGVTVTLGREADLSAFHRMYAETAARDGFDPLPADFFARLWQAQQAEDEQRVLLYVASREGEPHAMALRMRVGEVDSYTFGASTTAGRAWRPSNAMQWRMLSDAAAAGAAAYDLRGISDTLDPADPLFGLLRFKLGLGGDAVELVGEWDYPLRPWRHRAVAAYLERRAR